jgi:hypothetical protein
MLSKGYVKLKFPIRFEFWICVIRYCFGFRYLNIRIYYLPIKPQCRKWHTYVPIVHTPTWSLRYSSQIKGNRNNDIIIMMIT